MIKLSSALALIYLLAGCTSEYQVRGIEEPVGRAGEPANRVTVAEVETNPDVRRTLDARSIENFAHNPSNPVEAAEPIKGFDIGIVEFNDEGDGNLAQQQQVFELLDQVNEKAIKLQSRGPLIVTFIHGWHHNPSVCDGNLACFRRVLENLKHYEDEKRDQNGEKKVALQKPIIGIYVGWRGESMNTFSNLSFYGRKGAAEHIGNTGAKDFLLRLEKKVNEIKQVWKSPGAEPTMITVGHSFGGALLFSAIEGKLIGTVSGQKYIRSSQDWKERDPYIKPLRNTFGDLTILVNPAIEAERYEPFHKDLTDEDVSGAFAKDQLPVLITVASEADSAVGTFFPLGRSLGFLYKPWEISSTKTQGIGHYEEHITHKLFYEAKDEAQKANIFNKYSASGCSCEYPYWQYEPKEVAMDSSRIKGKIFEKKPRVIDFTGISEISGDKNFILTPVSPYTDTDMPYIVVSTDETVLPGHNDIYNPRFMEFLFDLIVGYQNKKELVMRKSYVDEATAH